MNTFGGCAHPNCCKLYEQHSKFLLTPDQKYTNETSLSMTTEPDGSPSGTTEPDGRPSREQKNNRRAKSRRAGRHHRRENGEDDIAPSFREEFRSERLTEKELFAAYTIFFSTPK